MKSSARIASAIEVLGEIAQRRRPASDALKDWGLSHRFAGSGDRAAIANLVYDALRRKASSCWRLEEESPRACMLGMLAGLRGLGVAEIEALFSGALYAPEPISARERACLTRDRDMSDVPAHIRGDYPEWLAGALAESFGEDAPRVGAALAQRAPVDVRVNNLKATREGVLKALAHLSPQATPFSPVGVRIPLTVEGRGPALTAEAAYVQGQVEVQDEASQLSVLLSGAKAGDQVLDLCAGAGGKSLALAAMLGRTGQIYASDEDVRRLAPFYARLERSGARNVQVRPPHVGLGDLEGRCDLVFVDAPCTGSGAWRRNPDAKWRIRPGALEQRLNNQVAVMAQAVRYVKPGGRLMYVTCSVLRAENEAQVAVALQAFPEFLPLDAATMAHQAGLPELAAFASKLGAGLRLDPLQTGTDGFYIAGLVRMGC